MATGAACAGRGGCSVPIGLGGEDGELLVELAAAAALAARRVRGAHERLELVAAGAAGVFEDRHGAILQSRSVAADN